MPALNCYKLKRDIDGNAQPDFDDYVSQAASLSTVGPVTYPDFEAKLYYSSGHPRRPSWGEFLADGLRTAIDWPRGQSTSALLIVRLHRRRRREYFALAFGPMGRFFLKDEGYRRAYGLKAALNIMHPLGADASGRLRTVDSKRRGATLVRSRAQASSVTTLDVFAIDRLRDVVGGVDGRPADTKAWGQRVAGADAFSLNREELDFASLGRLCRAIDAVAVLGDYRAQFAWLDYIQPVTDPVLVEALRGRAVDLIQTGEGDLDLTPPEIVDWSRIHRFQLPFDRRRGVLHPDLRLADLQAVLRRTNRIANLDYGGLRDRHVQVFDVDGHETYHWTLWKCLTGELELKGRTYVLDEGDFFEVQGDYLAGLNRWVDAIPRPGFALPACQRGDAEGTYNAQVAQQVGYLLLDQRLVRRSGETPIELCDLLTRERELIHVKKNSGSRDLSHLFSQGVVSAALLQEDPDFRVEAAQVVAGLPDGTNYDLFDGVWTPSDVAVVFAIVDSRWPGEASKILPFFSKVNLRRSVRDLEIRGYGVRLAPIRTA